MFIENIIKYILVTYKAQLIMFELHTAMEVLNRVKYNKQRVFETHLQYEMTGVKMTSYS